MPTVSERRERELKGAAREECLRMGVHGLNPAGVALDLLDVIDRVSREMGWSRRIQTQDGVVHDADLLELAHEAERLREERQRAVAMLYGALADVHWMRTQMEATACQGVVTPKEWIDLAKSVEEKLKERANKVEGR